MSVLYLRAFFLPNVCTAFTVDAIIRWIGLPHNDAVRQSYGDVHDAYLSLQLVGQDNVWKTKSNGGLRAA
jgi:hypothetical protein